MRTHEHKDADTGNLTAGPATQADKQRDVINDVRSRQSGVDDLKTQGAQRNDSGEKAQPAARPGKPFVTCPACNQGDLCPRRPSSLKDWLMRLVGLKPYRCNRCLEISYRR
jgi:hypothetical protein